MTNHQERKNLRVFGFGLSLIAAFFGIGGYLKHGFQWAPLVLMICSMIFALTTAWTWQALRPAYTGWMKIAHLIGTAVTTVILALIYFLVFTPVRLVLKLGGTDHLDRKIDRQASSYWTKRPKVAFQRARYHQQF